MTRACSGTSTSRRPPAGAMEIVLMVIFLGFLFLCESGPFRLLRPLLANREAKSARCVHRTVYADRAQRTVIVREMEASPEQ
jgi:hypothetical protein